MPIKFEQFLIVRSEVKYKTPIYLMLINEFIKNYHDAFGQSAELPIVFWYSDKPYSVSNTIQGCLYKSLAKIRAGVTLSLSEAAITCPGGRLYTGFDKMAEIIPNYVSLVERYKQTPEGVLKFISRLQLVRTDKKYLHFSSVKNIDTWDDKEGILFIASPDTLAGLTTWAWFDNDEADAVSTSFGSGCSEVIAQAVSENRRNGKRTFLGGFDPSVRPYLRANELTFTIPMSRWKEMLTSMPYSCLNDSHAWKKVQKRIDMNTRKTEKVK